MNISNFKFPFSNPAIWIILLIILIIPTFWSLLRPGFFPMQDDLQAFRLFEMDKCFQDFQIPCRWVPDMGYEYGYPQFNFYSPGVFYLGEVFHLLGFQFIDVVKVLFILGFVLSALTMFLFLQTIYGKFPALIGSLLYTYAPFKAVQVYVRGSLAEFWALVIFPLLFWSSYQLIQTRMRKYGIFFSLSVGVMLLTHNLTSLLILPILAVWILVLMNKRKNWSFLGWVVGFGLLGIGLASFFVLPALFEKQYVHTETLLSGYFDYRQHFVPLKKLLLDNQWGYGSSNLGQTETLNLSAGIVQWLLGITGFMLGIFYWKKDRHIFAGILALISLFMIHQKSSFIWAIIPGLNWLQFPWRFLALSTFFLSVSSTGAIYYLRKWPKVATIIGLGCVLVAMSLSMAFFYPKEWLNISDIDKFSGQSWEKQLTISIFDYLPVYAKLPPNHSAPQLPEVLTGQVRFSGYHKGSNYQSGQLNVRQLESNFGSMKNEGNATIRLPLFDFPGMKVEASNLQSLNNNPAALKPINHWHNDCQNQAYCLGLITFQLPPGEYRLKAYLSDTPIRTLGNLISLVSLVILIGLIFAPKIWRSLQK